MSTIQGQVSACSSIIRGKVSNDANCGIVAGNCKTGTSYSTVLVMDLKSPCYLTLKLDLW